jgi:ABC-2 type transport system ATP-binding protein
MITGLTPPSHGRATVAGRPFAELPNPMRTAGVLLDASAMHPGRSGRRTLHVAAAMAGVPSERVEDALHRVGLGNAGNKRVGAYSLGMRQRLGIAQALLGDPQLLILDEPANGLDPEGIAWMRRLLRDFADRGGTVLLSSHLLSEVQATVDHLVVIAGGQVVASGPMDELLATNTVIVRSPDRDALLGALAHAGAAFSTNPDGSVTVDASTGGFDPDVIGRLCLRHGIALSELRRDDATGLEDLFFSLTATNTADHSEAAA